MKNKTRQYFQFSILALIIIAILRPILDKSYHPDFEAYCPLGGISAIMSKLNLGSSSCQMGEVQMFLGISLIVGAVFFGKLFCSYICPIGTVMEWIGRLGDKLKIRFVIPEVIDRPLRVLKYLLLFATVYFTMTSSELFCKEFDPYLATVTGFGNGDIVLTYAIITLAIVIFGSLFTKMFWCKYLCPLGAIGNVFSNTIPVVGIIALYFIANAFGANLSLVWLLGGVVGIAMLSEVIFKRSFLFPLFKISRKESTCPTCAKCDDDCPQGIEVSSYNSVNHIDCNLCSDCIYACPVKQTLSINSKPTKFAKYIAPATTLILIAAGLIASTFYEFTTLSERWGNFEKLENVAVYHQEGLTTIKCFGSASSFRNQISRIKGIVGLDAYAASHTIDIYYNPKVISERGVKKSIFKPTKQKIRSTARSKVDSLSVFKIGINNFFDRNDYTNITYALRKNKAVYGFETMFGEPVETKIYFDDSKTNPDEIIKAIETKEIELKLRDGGTLKREIDFEVEGKGEIIKKISTNDYLKNMFVIYDKQFNKYRKTSIEKVKVLSFPMKEAGISSYYRSLNYLTSHLSGNKGIVRFATRFTNTPTAFIFFNEDKTNLEEVKQTITADTLSVHYSKGVIKKMKNPFKIKPEGNLTNASEINIDKK